MFEQEIDRLVSYLQNARKSAERSPCAQLRHCTLLSIVVSLATHACIAGVMRQAVLSSKHSTAAHIQLTHGRNAPVAIKVSFIEAQAEMKPAKEPTETPDPQDMVKPTGFQSITSDIELSSPKMRPDVKLSQPSDSIEAAELKMPAVVIAETVARPVWASTPIVPMAISRVDVRPENAPLEKRDPIEIVKPIVRPLGFNSDSTRAKPSSNKTTPSTAAEPGVVDGAKLAKPIAPEYPPACIRRGQQGTVILDIRVLSTGRAGEIKLFRSSGHAKLDAAAIDAARQARFTPARKNGRNVESQVKLPVKFLLK